MLRPEQLEIRDKIIEAQNLSPYVGTDINTVILILILKELQSINDKLKNNA